MDESQFLEVKAAIEKKLIFKMFAEARKIDVSTDPHLRFTLDFVFDQNGLLADSAVETNYGRPLK